MDVPHKFKIVSEKASTHARGSYHDTGEIDFSSRSSIQFFAIQRTGIERMNVPRMAPKFDGQRVFQISVMLVLQFDRGPLNTISAKVGLERGSGVALEEVHTLTPSLLSKESLMTARTWTSRELVIGFGHPIPAELQAASQVLLHSCLPARNNQGVFLLRRSGIDDEKFLETARCFQRAGVLACTSEQGDYRESTWKLTPEGEARLSVSVVLRTPQPTFRVREGIALEDMTTFELLRTLLFEEWACRLQPPRTRRLALAFHVGGEKVFYDKRNQSTLQRLYLLSLLRAEDHQQPVLPFSSVGYYKCILSGRPWAPPPSKQKALTFNMQFEGVLQNSVVAALPLEDAKPPERQEGNGGCSDSQDSNNRDSGDGESGDGYGGDADSVETAGGGDIDGGGRDDLEPAEAGAVTSLPHLLPGAEAEAGSNVERLHNQEASSFEWREHFMFTKTFTNQFHIGWQATCYCHNSCRTHTEASRSTVARTCCCGSSSCGASLAASMKVLTWQ